MLKSEPMCRYCLCAVDEKGNSIFELSRHEKKTLTVIFNPSEKVDKDPYDISIQIISDEPVYR